MAGSLLDEVAGPAPQPQAQNPPVNASNQGSLLDQVAAEQTPTTPVSTTNTGATSPSYLDEVQNHVTNTAKALWHGVVGTPETPEETGAPVGTPEKQLGFTNENVAYKGGAAARAAAGFFGGLAKDVVTMKPLPKRGTNLEENSPELAKSLVGKYIAAPSIAARDKAAEELRQYYNAPDTATAVSHGLNYMINRGAQWVPLAGPLAAGLVDAAEKGDIGGTLAQLAAFEAFGKATEHVTEPIKNQVGLAMLSPEDRAGLQAEAEKRAAAAKQTAAEQAQIDATNSTMKGPLPKTPNTIAGKRTLLRPTTQTTAGVEAPISAVQQENPSRVTELASKFLTNRGAAEDFRKEQTAPAATNQLAATVSHSVEDKTNAHNAIMENRPTPDKISGTQTTPKYQSMDEAAQAAEATAQKTYRKADAASDADIAAWQQTVKEALNEHKALLDRHNANIDAYNDNLSEGEEKMPHAVYDPNSVRIPEKPQSYSELKAELDRAKADSNSSDAAIREEAYKTGIPKAEKAIDQWFKQHSDVISPAEYDSAKKLYADSQRFQDIANGLRSATNKGTITGNTLRGLEASIDNKMIRRGQAPGAFRRLLGDEGYDNWQTVTKLFDPIKNAPKGIKSWGVYALEAASALVAPKLAIGGIAGTMATKFLMDRVMFDPAWGAWFSKFATGLKDMVTREHGELGAPGTVGEKFGEGGAKREFNELMDRAPGKAAAEVKAQAQPASLLDQVAKPEGYTGEERRAGARPTMSATELEDAIKNRRPINNPFDQTEGARATMNRDLNMPQPAGVPQGLPEARPAETITPEQKAALSSKEIATSNPQTVNADTTNNPDRTSGLTKVPDKMKQTQAQAIANYKDAGLKLTPDEQENPADHANSIIKKAVNHYKNNLVALYNAIPESIRGISKQWYESAHTLSKDFAKQYGIAHEQAAAVIAALSPNNPWDNNVGMAQRLMERWKNDRTRLWDEKMDEKLSAIRNAKSTKPEFRSYLDSIRGKQYNELQGTTPAETSAMRGIWLRMADQAYGSPEIPVYAPDGTIRGSQKITWGPYDAVAKAVNLLDDGSVENIDNLMGNGHKIRNFYNNIINPWSDRGHVTIDTHAVGAAHWKPFSQKDTEVAHNFGTSTPGVPGAGKHAATGIAGTYPIYDEAYKQAAKEVGVSPRELQSITWEGIRSLFSGAKKTPELRKAIAEIWRNHEAGKISADEARQQIIEKAGGFKRPVWTTDQQWDASRGKAQAATMHQMTSLGTGDYKVSADFNPPVAHPELKGTPEPALGRKPNGQPDWSKLQDIADWKNANVEHEDALNSALHEVAHTEVQHALGVPTENVRIKLGHSAIRKGVPPLEGGRPSSMNGISGGFLDPGGAWQEKMDAAYQTGDPSQIKSVVKDWVTQLMAGRAVEEMTGMPYSKIQEHIRADVAMAKRALKHANVPSYIHDVLLTESTNAAKAILHQNFDKVRHTATQAINHYGAEPIDGKTFLKYRNGGVYEKK